MDHFHPITSTVHNVHVIPGESVSSMPTSVQSQKPNEQMRFPEPTDHYGGRPQIASPGNSAFYIMPSHSGLQQLAVPNSILREAGAMFSNPRPQQSQMLVKRKSPMENLPGYPLSPRVAMPNMKIGQLENRPWLNTSVPSKGNSQQVFASHLTSQQVSVQNKRTVQFQAGSPRSVTQNQKSSTPRGHPSQGQPSPRVPNESNEPVRSKLRESIRDALALVIIKEKSSIQGVASDSTGAIASEEKQEGSQSAEIDPPILIAERSVDNSENSTNNCSTQIQNKVESQSSATASQVCSSLQTHESVGQESSIIDLLPDEESIAGQFFGKDDLLKGNGLSWVLDFDDWISEKEGHDPKKQKVGENVVTAQEVKKPNSPQNLAFQIELELFKLFGGVNKKYKEKGRSLLFNLKDRNNPELREKVMSGVISPARLCSMSAEELASKELSEWRIAKAEEFDQMKILPDSDIDIRRLVKKTHKGEFQVEVEEDDVSVEVSVGSSSIPRIQTETKETMSPSGEKSDGDKKELVIDENNSDENVQCTITIPSNESSDLMQGFIEDEMKDAEFLPPIVSLDEFMESLNSEPPFENLPSDAATAVDLANDPSEVPTDSKSDKLSPDGHTSDTSKAQEDNLDKVMKPNPDIKPDGQQLKEISSPSPTTSTKSEQIWEGTLQLSISSTVAVTGFFKSGEKAPTNEWSRAIEIKGRVRLDAFEKFLQDLHKSRSRHIMVMHLILKEQEGKDSEALSQVVDSYVADDRVGFAELRRGVEAYLCPCHPKLLDRIAKQLPKDQTESLTLAGDSKGLIGVIVWRKALVSPNSSSHNKHSLKKHQQEHNTSSRRHYHQDRNMNVNSSNVTHKYPVAPVVSSKTPLKAATQEDDLPPGFGPPATQEDDDLPEFNFSGGLSRSAPNPTQSRPADQMRQLVQKYGQNAGSGFAMKSGRVVDDDDDDDIPEWQPQGAMTPAPQSNSQQQNYLPLDQSVLQHLISQQQQLQRPPWQQPLQPPMHIAQQNSPSRWLPPQQQQSGIWMNPPQGQFHGAQSRGF